MTYRDAGIARLAREREREHLNSIFGAYGVTVGAGKLVISIYDHRGKQKEAVERIQDGIAASK